MSLSCYILYLCWAPCNGLAEHRRAAFPVWLERKRGTTIQPDCGHKSCLWQIVPQDSKGLCPSPQAVFPIGDKAVLRGPAGKSELIKMFSVLFCPHLHLLWPHNPFSQSNVPWGPSALEGESHSPIHLEMELWLLSFGHWPCQGVQWAPNSLPVPS